MTAGPAFLIELDGAKLQTEDDFYRELGVATQLELTSNLDALDEDLVYEIPLNCGPYRIVWKAACRSNWSGYSKLNTILGILTRQQQRHPDRFVDLTLAFEPEDGEDTWTYPELYAAPHYVAERERRLAGKKQL